MYISSLPIIDYKFLMTKLFIHHFKFHLMSRRILNSYSY